MEKIVYRLFHFPYKNIAKRKRIKISRKPGGGNNKNLHKNRLSWRSVTEFKVH